MGQIFFLEDKIGLLSHNAGDISLAPSRITIGGQQYETSTLVRTISTDVTLTANNRYQVYVVINSGSPQLRISTNENSVGPIGFTGWKLVGSFYSSGASQFGGFITIEGSPMSDWIDGGPLILGGTTAAPNKGVTTDDRMLWRQVGKNMEIRFEYSQSSNAGASTGTGDILFGIPTNKTIDTTVLNPYSTVEGSGSFNNNNAVGVFCSSNAGTTPVIGFVSVYDSINVRAFVQNPTAQAAVNSVFADPADTGTLGYQAEFTVPITEFSNIAIKDL